MMSFLGAMKVRSLATKSRKRLVPDIVYTYAANTGTVDDVRDCPTQKSSALDRVSAVNLNIFICS